MTADLLALLDQLDEARAKATPGPWVADSHEIYQGIPGFLDVPNVGEWIGETCRLADDPLGDGDANAALIVAAVNAAPKLTAVLRAVLDLAEEIDGELGDYGYRIRNGLDPSPADRIRVAITAALTPEPVQP